MWPYHGEYPMMGGYGPWGWGMVLAHAVFWVAILVLIVWVAITLTRVYRERSHAGSASTPRKAEPAGLAVLGERYARGEIGREEYLQKKQDLAA